MSKLEELKSIVERGKAKLAAAAAQGALDEGESAKTILDTMISAMDVVGEKFSTGEIFVPEMLMAAKAMSKGVEVIQPLLAENGSEKLGKCIIGTVAGDLHDIGKNLVSLMIGAAGFEMVDLGVDVPAEKFVEAIKANPDCNLVACSALLTTTMPSLENTVKVIRESGLTGFKIIVGGAPITQEFADKIGADGYSSDAGSAAMLAKNIIK